MTNFTTVVEAQCRHMMHMAQRLDERGYIVFVHKLNDWGDTDAFLYAYFDGGLKLFFRAWRKRERRAVVTVDVFPDPKDRKAISVDSKPFDHPFSFKVDVPRRLSCRGLVASLELMAATTKGRGGKVTGTGMLLRTELSDRFEFKGNDRGALTAVLHVLEMPHHRDILIGKKPNA